METSISVVSYSAGGGGYGNPKEREIDRVLNDYKEGWISKERASETYGVQIDKNDEIDLIATEKLRKT